MKLVSFSVENYRSITTARKVPLSEYSILIGGNNEGKSNILHALALGMEALAHWLSTVRRLTDGRFVRTSPTSQSYRRGLSYNWDVDFPIGKQTKASKSLATKITLEFQLDESEKEEFKSDIKSSLNGTLPILLTFNREGFELSVQKPGRGHATLNKKSTRIAAFVSERIAFTYIPAIRTSESASRIISILVDRELRTIEDNSEYVEALKKIESLQEPIFKKLAKTIQSTIAGFLPSVKSVELKPLRDARSRALRREVEILVDDGNLTQLSRKGDGVQSLTALALMRHSAEESQGATHTIIAIEEPESHLHPRAIHELRAVIEALSENSQIVLTTHSPLFVKANKLKNTVIVHNSKAKCAERISEIRDALGVRFSDNLQNARLVLIFEGKDDVVALQAILAAKSPIIRVAVDDGIVAFDDLGGAGSLAQKAAFYQSSACQVQAFMDNDAAGKLAVSKAITSRSIGISDVNLANFPSKDESELEDLYDTRVYRTSFLEKFGVDISKRPTGKTRGKWSDVVERLFKESGKPWDQSIKSHVKLWLAEFAADNPQNIIRAETQAALLAFITSVETKIRDDA